MNSKDKILYLSQGKYETGGYFHELFLSKSILKFYHINENNLIVKRIKKTYDNSLLHFLFLIKVFFKKYEFINVVTAKTALMCILRNWFNKKLIFVVIHNHDEASNYSNSFKTYFKILIWAIKKSSPNKVKLIVESKFWQEYFSKKYFISPEMFPNLFDVNYYKKFIKKQKNNWIFLGQWSSKNDEKITQLAQYLSQSGYYCYFSTNNFEEAKPHNGKFEIINFFNHSDYLEQVSMSLCTLALTKINEGWNRIAHESILIGTPIIGYKKGGLGDLLSESNSIVVKNIDEAYECIMNKIFVIPDEIFINKYDISKTPEYLSKFLK